MKIVLAGTPNFSVPTFTKIIENFEVVALISQPDRPTGRTMTLTIPPTVMLAKHHRKIKILQPQKIEDLYDELKDIDFDVLLTMAYGQIIPESILKLAKKGSYNIHGSLLPMYRGASPIQYAINNGDEVTGITFMEMSPKMDAGDIIFQEKLVIKEEDNYDSIYKKMSQLSANCIVDWLKSIERGNFTKTKQNDNEATYAPKISKEDERIPYDTVENTINKVRSLSSNPGAFLIVNTDQPEYSRILSKRMKVFKVSKTFVPNSVRIDCLDGVVYAVDFQFEGRKRVSVI